MEEKWYSHKLTEEKAKKLHRSYGIVNDVSYEIHGFCEKEMGLRYRINIEDSAPRGPFIINDTMEIYNFLKASNVQSIDNLEGKVVEVFFEGLDSTTGEFKGFCPSYFFRNLK